MSQGLTLYLCFLIGPSKESLFLLYKAFLRPLLTYASPEWFPFLSVTDITKLERLDRAASRAITGCLSSFPIPLLVSEAVLPPQRATLTYFTLSSYERALRLPTSFPISGLVRLGVKLCRSSWRAFTSTPPIMLPSISSREALLACPLFLLWNLPCSLWSPLFPLHALALISLSLAKVQLLLTLTLSPLMIWYSGLTTLFLFRLASAALVYLPTALSVASRPLFPFPQAQYVKIFPLQPTPLFMFFAGLGSTNKPAISLFFSYYLTLVLSAPSIIPFSSHPMEDLAGTVFSLLFYQTTMGSRTLVSPRERRG